VKKGISLIELLVVMVIVSIILLIIMNLTSYVIQRSRFSGAVNNLISDIAWSKQIAAKENRWVKFMFTTRNYIISKQVKIGDLTNWKQIKKVIPYDNKPFFNTNDITDFAINSRGEVKKVSDLNNPSSSPSTITIKIYIKKGGKKLFHRTIIIFPYGGVKVEKK